MRYELADLPLKSLLPALGDAEDQLARLDERVARSEVGAGFIERGHFFDAAASMWVNGELVHVEDLVLRDAWMDIRTPTHETGLAHGIVRARRKIAAAPAGWPLTSAGLKALRGRALDEELPEMDRGRGGEELEHPGDREEDDALAIEFAEIDAVLARSNRLLAGEVEAAPAPVEATMAGDLMIRDPEWNEDERLGAWLDLTAEADRLPPSLGAALLWTAQGQLVLAYPSPARKARLFAIFWATFSCGGLVGGLVELGVDWRSDASVTSRPRRVHWQTSSGLGRRVWLNQPTYVTTRLLAKWRESWTMKRSAAL